MTVKTVAQLRAEITDKFRADAQTSQSLPARLTEFLNNVIDSMDSLYASKLLLISDAGAPVDYTDGTPPATGEGTAPKGSLYVDTTNGFVYRNSGTVAQPAWTKLADAA